MTAKVTNARKGNLSGSSSCNFALLTVDDHLTQHRGADDNARMIRSRARVAISAAAVAAAAIIFSIFISSAGAQATTQKGNPMSAHATGPFEVKLTPQDDKIDSTLGRMTIAKQLRGDLEATSKGQMLTASTDTKGSAAYVAVERVTGTLRTADGPRKGSFALYHLGTMTRGTPELAVTVVPDSGTGELTGIAGKMNIIITEGEHSYDFEYTLP
jgi:hypothetical protein